MPPPGTQREGWTVRQMSREKLYRCPGCQQEIHPGTPHLVVFPEGDPDSRKHWHTPCWIRELKLFR